MTVSADNFALVNLSFDFVERISIASQHGNVCQLVTLVVELKHDDIALTAVGTRMVFQVFNYEFIVDLDLFYVPRSRFLNILRAICLIMRPHIFVLTAFAHGLSSATSTAANCKILYRLRWWPAFGANLHVHGATITSSRRLFNVASLSTMAARECRLSRGRGRYLARRRGLRAAPGG